MFSNIHTLLAFPSQNLASKCVNFSLFEHALPLGDRNVSSTRRLLTETLFDTGGEAEKGWAGQSDLPAASWQPEDTVRGAANQTLCEPTC